MNDVKESVAFNILGDLLKGGKIDEAEATYLKTKFQKAFDTVNAAKVQEATLIKKAKMLSNDILGEKITLDKCRLEEADENAQLRRLEDERDNLQAELETVEQHDTMAKFELAELKKVHEELSYSLDVMKKENGAIVEPALDAIRTNIVELNAQLREADQTFEKETAQKDALLANIDEMDNTKLVKLAQMESLLEEYGKVEQVPARLSRQIESIEKAAASMESEHLRLLRKIRSIDFEMEKQTKKKTEAEKLRKGLMEKLELHRQTIEEREQDVAVVRINLQNEKARAHDLMTRKVEVNVVKRDSESTARHRSDQCSLSKKEYDNLKRQLKKKRSIADSSKQVIPNLNMQIQDNEAILEGFNTEHADLTRVVGKLKEEQEYQVVQFVAQEGIEHGKAEELEKICAVVNELESDNIKLMSEERRQGKFLAVLSAQRDIKARDSARVEQKLKEARQYVRMKELMILDLTKRCNEISNRLKEFSALYEVVKNERNKYVNLIQSSAQALAEMREKIRILNNEVEILSTESATKDKALIKEKNSHQQAQNQRDSLRQEMNKLLSEYRQKQGVVEQQIMDIDKLNVIINILERDMLELKKRYEQAVGERNGTGVQLIERNDELCILYERSNQQLEAIKRGERALHTKDVELRMLRLQTEELNRQYSAAKSRLPNIERDRSKIAVLESKILEERKKTDALSTQLEDPQNLERWRPLNGDDPDLEHLIAKISILEERLDSKREQLLEKELILEEVGSLTERLKTQAVSKRDVAKSMADQLNGLQDKIRDTTKKMLASVSELSLYQATALRLQQEKLRREQELEEGKWRVDHGECPSELAAKEWNRAERRRLQQVETNMKNQEAEEQRLALSTQPLGMTRTTADPRPTAYIPEELGIPKPYGLLAPFKPSESGTTMKQHIRNPVPKAIEI